MASPDPSNGDTASLVMSDAAQIKDFCENLQQTHLIWGKVDHFTYPVTLEKEQLKRFRAVLTQRYDDAASDKKEAYDNNTFRARIDKLPFSAFCVITLSLSQKEITSLPDRWWSFLIQLLLPALGKDKLPSDTFRRACGDRTTKASVFYRNGPIAERFDEELAKAQNSSGNGTQPEAVSVETRQTGERDSSQSLETTVRSLNQAIHCSSSLIEASNTPPAKPSRTLKEDAFNPSSSNNVLPPREEGIPADQGGRNPHGIKRPRIEESPSSIPQSSNGMGGSLMTEKVESSTISKTAQGEQSLTNGTDGRGRSRDEIRNHWREAMGLPSLIKQPQTVPTKVTRIPEPTGDPAFSKFFPSIQSFLPALRCVIANAKFRCVVPMMSSLGPMILAPSGYGFRAVLAYSSPLLLANWLELTIDKMRGYILSGEQLCDYLEFWLAKELVKDGKKVSFEGVLAETDEMVFLQKPGAEICFMFDDYIFDSVALSLQKRI